MSYDENQIVKAKWNTSNKKWFESKGYVYTKMHDELYIKAKDLKPHSNVRIKANCDYCHEDYETIYASVTGGKDVVVKDCCANCAGKKANEITWKRRADKYFGAVRKMCEERGYTLITTIDEYTDVKMMIRFICPKHGEQTMMLDNLVRGCECIDCSYEKRGNGLKHDINYVINKIEEVNGNVLLNPGDYKDAVTRNLDIKCACGNIFTTSFVNYTKHGVDTCYSCSCKESSGESIIREFLNKYDIWYVQEKRFEDCRDKKPLPFDFYLQDYDMCVEFDGQHHYYVTRNEEDYVRTVRHDNIKNEYCRTHDIRLLRIPYWEGRNIEAILSKELNIDL